VIGRNNASALMYATMLGALKLRALRKIRNVTMFKN